MGNFSGVTKSGRVRRKVPESGARSVSFVMYFCMSFNAIKFRAQMLCETQGGRPGFPVPNSPQGVCGRKATEQKKKMC